MPKHLDQPILVVAPQYADRLDITAYRVDADARTVTLTISATRDDGAGGRVRLPYPPHVLDEAATIAAMVAAGRNVVRLALTALAIDPAKIAAIDAGLAARPEAAEGAYYLGTRDALYTQL